MRPRQAAAAVLTVVFLAGVTVAAAEAGELAKLFPYQAPLSADRSGLHRVELPPEVLQHCRADLSDLRVFDVRGRLVRTLVDEVRPEGRHTVMWNGRTANGALLPSGVYFSRITAGDFQKSRKIVLMH